MTVPTPPAVSEAMREAVAPTYGIIDPDYARVFTQARCLAWAEGYALMMHGSFTRDLDLIAVPWTGQACEPEHLVNRIADAADLTIASSSPGLKEHGRLAWTLLFQGFGDPRFVDLSIMPRASEIARLKRERDAARLEARNRGDMLDATAGMLQRRIGELLAERKLCDRRIRGQRAALRWLWQLSDLSRGTRSRTTLFKIAQDRGRKLRAAEAETARLRADAERFRALMRCGRIKPQGSAGVDPKTGERRYPDDPGAVHFGAEFWVAPEDEPSNLTIWGRHCLRALADDILAFEARAALSSQEKTDV